MHAVTSRELGRWLVIAVAVVSGLGLSVELWGARAHGDLADILVPRLSLSYEANVPTWFASTLLFTCALAAGAIAREATTWVAHWWGVVSVFGIASLDEAIGLHEHLGGHLDTAGVLYFDWVIWAAAILAVTAIIFLPFVRALAPATRIRLVIAGAVYLMGAVGMELPLGVVTERLGTHNLVYALVDWIEETLEMIGASLALRAFVRHREPERVTP